MTKQLTIPWKHWCTPTAAWRAVVGRDNTPGMWNTVVSPCLRCGQAAPELVYPEIDPEYFDKKREELRDEYRTGLDAPPK